MSRILAHYSRRMRRLFIKVGTKEDSAYNQYPWLPQPSAGLLQQYRSLPTTSVSLYGQTGYDATYSRHIQTCEQSDGSSKGALRLARK